MLHGPDRVLSEFSSLPEGQRQNVCCLHVSRCPNAAVLFTQRCAVQTGGITAQPRVLPAASAQPLKGRIHGVDPQNAVMSKIELRGRMRQEANIHAVNVNAAMVVRAFIC